MTDDATGDDCETAGHDVRRVFVFGVAEPVRRVCRTCPPPDPSPQVLARHADDMFLQAQYRLATEGL